MLSRGWVLFRIATATVLCVTAICGTARYLLHRNAQLRAEEAAGRSAAQVFLRKYAMFDPPPQTALVGMDTPFSPDTLRQGHYHVDLSTATRYAWYEAGLGETITDEAVELEEIVRSSNAAEQLHALAWGKGSDSSKLYALVGLRWIGSSEYQPLLCCLKKSRASVGSTFGCCVIIDKVARIAGEIDSGHYDRDRPRKRGDIDLSERTTYLIRFGWTDMGYRF